MLEVESLQCIRGERVLFKNLSFRLTGGSILYVEGVNGSGKTTLLRTLCGLSQPHKGHIRWNSQDIQELAEDYTGQALYIGHLAGIKEDLTAVENLQFSSALAGNVISKEDAVSALTQIGIAKCADLPARVLSQGQKRRVSLARLWLQDNPLWILDEPFTALDTAAIEVLSQHIERFVGNGGIAIITTHQEPSFSPDILQRLLLN